LQKKIERSKSLKYDSARFMILAEKS